MAALNECMRLKKRRSTTEHLVRIRLCMSRILRASKTHEVRDLALELRFGRCRRRSLREKRDKEEERNGSEVNRGFELPSLRIIMRVLSSDVTHLLKHAC
jgi:hypothetical protein